MEIKFIALVNEFHDTLEEKDNINREELRILCKAPFIQLRDIITSDSHEDVRLKHLGSFKILKKSIKNLLYKNDVCLEKRYITEEEHAILKTKLENKLKEDDNTKEDL